jgi:ABC-type bacteriocin/lantibiotic exporter with double-glycine peptidase domain
LTEENIVVTHKATESSTYVLNTYTHYTVQALAEELQKRCLEEDFASRPVINLRRNNSSRNMVLLDDWTYSTRTFKVANGLFWATFLLVTIAFSTPYWLISIPDDELPNPKFTNLGKLDIFIIIIIFYNYFSIKYLKIFYSRIVGLLFQWLL